MNALVICADLRLRISEYETTSLAMLKTYLHERLEEYTAKDDNPRYERDAAVINTIQDSVARPEGVLV